MMLREIRLQHLQVALDDAAQIADIGAWVSIARSSLRKSSGACGSPPISYMGRSHGHIATRPIRSTLLTRLLGLRAPPLW